MPFSEITAIIPASGRGERFGGPKADAVLGSSTFLERIQTTLAAAGISNVSVAQVFGTPNMLATLRRAVRELSPSSTKAYLIFPVDHPFVLPETVIALCEAWISNPDAVYRPAYQGRTGHPVLIPAWLDLEQNDQGQGLAGIIRNQACTVVDLPVEDFAVIRNINTPKDLED